MQSSEDIHLSRIKSHISTTQSRTAYWVPLNYLNGANLVHTGGLRLNTSKYPI